MARLVKYLGVAEALMQFVQVKRRRRGCRDERMLLSLIFSFSAGGGHLSEVDILGRMRGVKRPIRNGSEFSSRSTRKFRKNCPCVMADNYRTYKHAVAKDWLGRYRRFQLHFTPSSWENLIECFFAHLTEVMRRPRDILLDELLTLHRENLDESHARRMVAHIERDSGPSGHFGAR